MHFIHKNKCSNYNTFKRHYSAKDCHYLEKFYHHLQTHGTQNKTEESLRSSFVDKIIILKCIYQGIIILKYIYQGSILIFRSTVKDLEAPSNQ